MLSDFSGDLLGKKNLVRDSSILEVSDSRISSDESLSGFLSQVEIIN